MNHELIHPNLHVALVHFPLGIFIVGVLIELLSFMYRGSVVRTAGRWMILFGALASIPAALSGAYAFADVAHRSMRPSERMDQPWADVIVKADFKGGLETTSTAGESPQYAMLERHVWLQSAATIAAVFAAVVGLGCSDVWRKRLYIPLLLLLLGAAAAMVWGGWAGGEVVYKYGTAVEDGMRTLQRPGDPTIEQPNAAAHWLHVPSRYYVQGHVLLAGITAAVALAALGLSWRAAGNGRRIPADAEEEHITDPAFDEPGRRPAHAQDVAMFRSFQPKAAVYDVPASVPSGRWWLIAFLLALLTAAGGFWFLASATDAFNVAEQENRKVYEVVWDKVTEHEHHHEPGKKENEANPPWLTRRFAHVALGGAIVVVPLIMALLSRIARKSRVLLSISTLLTVAAVAAQVWVGLLLMHDSPHGTIYGPQPRATPPPAEIVYLPNG